MKSGILVVAVFAAAVPAQTTWIVDRSGTGNFTDLAPAIAAASPGDTLLLRGGGSYQNIYYLDKPLNVVGMPPQRPQIDSLFQNQLTAPGQSTFQNLQAYSIVVWHPATFEDVRATALRVHAGGPVSLHGCTLGRGTTPYFQTDPALMIYGSAVTVSQCTIRGNAGFAFSVHCQLLPGRTVWMNGGNLAISGSTVEGADSNTVFGCSGWSPAGPALELYAGVVRVTHSSMSGGFSQTNVQAPPTQISGGALWRDSSVTFTPTSSPGSALFYPGAEANSAPPGGSITARVRSGPNLPAALVAGLGLRAPVNTPFGEAWIDPAVNLILRIGFTDAAGALDATVALPNSAPPSLPITFQGLVVPGTTGPLTLGAPVVVQVL